MLDIRNSTPTISHEFALASARAMQCPALDPVTGEWYVSQAENFGALENMQITRNSASGPKHKKISVMRIVRGGHGSTITVLHRNGVLGIVTNAWGKLHWIRYRPGNVRKGDPDAVPIWSGSYAHIDHETSTVCLRSGNSFKLYALEGDRLGPQIGKTLTDMKGPGPGQGFCSGKHGGEFYVFSMWDYGRPSSKPTVVVGSVTTGKRLYARSLRLFPKAKRNEPESGVVLDGVLHVGMSLVMPKKMGVLVALPAADAPPPPPPPPVVTMTVRPAGDPIWTDPPPNFVTNRIGTGAFGTIERPSDYVLSGVVGPHPKLPGQFLKVGPNEYYRAEYLTMEKPA